MDKLLKTKILLRISLSFIIFHFSFIPSSAASKYDNPDTIIVARDGTGEALSNAAWF